MIFLRSRQHRLWEKDSREALFVRRLATKPEPSYSDFRDFCQTRPAEVVANIAICLVHQTNYLLDQQIRRLERDFISEGGIRERMARVRLQQRRSTGTARESRCPADRRDRAGRPRQPICPMSPISPIRCPTQR